MATRIFLVLFLTTVSVNAKDYCKYNCGNGFVNIGCNHSGKPAATCVDFQRLDLGRAEKQLVVDEHNNCRSFVAKGQARNSNGQNLPTATNMNELVWDDELAHLAYLNVLQCKMKTDKCRDTETQNGQNSYNILTTTSSSVDELIREGIQYWFDQVQHVQLSEISSFSGGKGKVISNFTQVVWAKTTRVGCAIAKYKDGKYNSYLMVCNYVYGNRYGESVYQAGTTCSACSSCTRRGLCKQ